MAGSFVLAAWTNAELHEALRIADEIVFKAAALSVYTRLAMMELRLRERLAREHERIAKKADKAYVSKVRRAKSITEAKIDKWVKEYVKNWNGYPDKVADDLDATIAFAQEAGKIAIYQRLYGAEQRAVYNGPPFQEREPEVIIPVSAEVEVEKAELDIKPSTTLADQRAIEQIQKGQKFWMGKYHGTKFQTQVTQVSREILIEQGLPIREAAIRLGTALGYQNGYLPVKPAAPIPKGWKGSTLQYFDGVAANAATVSRIHGALTAMVEVGVLVYEVLNPLDERTCPRCELMNGAVLDVKKSHQHIVDVIGASPDMIPTMSPWLSESEFVQRFNAGGAARMQADGVGYPPFHFKCRCTVDVRPDEFTTPVSVPPATQVPERVIPKQPKIPIQALSGFEEASGGVMPMDAEWIEHNAVNWRLERVLGKDRIVARFKITEGKAGDVFKKMRAMGAEDTQFEFMKHKGLRKPGQTGPLQFDPTEPGAIKTRAWTIRRRNVDMRFLYNVGERALINYVEIVAKTPDRAKAWRSVRQMMRDLGIKSPARVPIKNQRLLAKARIIAQHDAILAESMRDDIAVSGFEAIERHWKKIVKQRPKLKQVFKDSVRKEVAPGHSAFYSEAQAELAQKQGVTALVHSVSNSNVLANILDGTGLLSSRNRFARGIFTRGMSTLEDFRTGGASSVFTRLTNSATLSERSGGIRIIINRRQLGRLDWYAYADDQYGTVAKSMLRERITVDKLGRVARFEGNEVMFEHGIGADAIEAILVSPERRLRILKELKEAGITKVGERNIEDVIVTTWRAKP